jgi:hypothetical protein
LTREIIKRLNKLEKVNERREGRSLIQSTSTKYLNKSIQILEFQVKH